ncbi:MAG: alpha-D-glucose phosphate-specific phosphoglucomutase [Bryobacterales bacterium]|nr:alpha-D-glucose phosphate-specific phosphoglucomutase [Bryobacterales bacterium]
MPLHEKAGLPAPADTLIDVTKLEKAYYGLTPDAAAQPVSFGTSGHRGSSLLGTFQEAHILAITQAICDYRKQEQIDGPLFMGMDSHALSAAAHRTAIEVLSANGVSTIIHRGGHLTPTPVISHAILTHNAGRARSLADGIVITPSHNPPEDGGFKYNPPNGGPAESAVTSDIQSRANEYLRQGNKGVRRSASRGPSVEERDMISAYVADLENVLDMAAIAGSGLSIGVDPLGGASLSYWEPIAEKYKLKLTVVNKTLDPAFRFMTLDHDGKIRMDCSSPYAMKGLIDLKDKYDISFGNDPDADRHGIVSRSSGLLNPNHYLAVAIDYLLTHRPDWPAESKVGKTLVSSSLIDRVVAALNRPLYEVPVGFKWFAPGLFDGFICFGGEESAGASFLRRNGRVWTTDKDGLILGLLAAEITARLGRDPGERYAQLEERFGRFFYQRIDEDCTPPQQAAFKALTPEVVDAATLAGDPILVKTMRAPGNGAEIGGLKIATSRGWFAVRPSGTEPKYKVYAESTASAEHLRQLVSAGKEIVGGALARSASTAMRG